MLKELLVNQVIPEVLFFIVSISIAVITYLAKSFYKDHKECLEYQKQQLIQRIGIDEYNHDIKIAKGLVMSIEQQAKSFDWHGALKHTKATELISRATGLNAEEIDNVIMSTVGELNKDKPIAASK
jgi:hypothetical protein